MLDTNKVSVTIDIRDMKWLSNYQRYMVNTTDPDIIVGNTEGSIDIDFSLIQTTDLAGDSMFEVGGRAYFETGIYGS